MIFFSSDPDFKHFYESFTKYGLEIDLLVTEPPKKQGRKMQITPNPAHQFAEESGLKVLTFSKLDPSAASCIKDQIPSDGLGFIFAYGKIIPEEIIELFKNGILNIHFSLLPEYPGASPIQQALLDNKKKTGYSIFKITKLLDQGLILAQGDVQISPVDNFESLRSKIIQKSLEILPAIIDKYLKSEAKLTEMPALNKESFTHRIKKSDGLLTDADTAQSAYNKTRAFSRWPKTYFEIEGKRLILHQASLEDEQLVIEKIQPEGKKPMNFDQFKNGYQTLLTKLPKFVKVN